jgi:hypothetical protein
MPNSNTTKQVTDEVRAALRRYRGRYPTLLALIKEKNPRTRITRRWLQAFSDRKDKEPGFSKVAELGAALGIEVEISTHATRPLLPPTHPRA